MFLSVPRLLKNYLRIIVELSNNPDLTVIIPCYNKFESITQVVNNLEILLKFNRIDFKLIVVDDGSIDGTTDLLRSFPKDYLDFVELPTNFGKGYAIRTGLSRISNSFVAIFDADLDLNPNSLIEAFKILSGSSDYDLVIGSKLHKDSKVGYPISRRVLSFFYRKLIGILFNLKVTDTQVGIKMFRFKTIQTISEKLSINSFAIDLEILVVANDLGFIIKEIPINLDHKFNSTVNLISIFKILKDTFLLKYRTLFQIKHH